MELKGGRQSVTANVDRAAAAALFSDGGEMGDRLQKIDWSRTGFGSVDRWPQSLKTAVKVCLDASLPMAIWWRVDTSDGAASDGAVSNGDESSTVTGSIAKCSEEDRSEKEHSQEKISEKANEKISEKEISKKGNSEEGRAKEDLFSDRWQAAVETICNDAYHLSLGTLSLSSVEDLLPKISTENIDTDAAVQTVLATGKTARLEYQWEDVSGTRSFLFSYSPLFDENWLEQDGAGEGKSARGVFASAVETTVQKASEATQAQMQAEVLHCEAAMEQSVQKAQQQMTNVLESISDAFIAFDRNWHYTYVNQKAAQLLHQESKSLIGQPVWKDAFPGKDGTVAYQELSRAMQDGVPVVFEDYSPSFDTWFEVHGYPSADGLSIYFQDVSDRKKTEAAREKMLAEEQAAREAAEAAVRLKDEFLSVVSHELRSPLNPILGCAELLKKGELSSERRERALDSIERNARIQAQLINDLLDVSQILQGELNINKCSVPTAPAIQSTIESLALEAQSKDIEVKAYLGSATNSVLADPGRLHQILWNLLSNAIKFTPRSGRVIIRARRMNNQVKFSVTDTGKGIHRSFLPYVFDRFRQEDGASTRQFGGLGLGLSIVRHLVELHNGTVEASSPGENQGATFTFCLPVGNSRARVAENGKHKQALNQTSAEAVSTDTGYGETADGMASATMTNATMAKQFPLAK